MKRLKDKLYNYEVSPPPGTWNKITSELDQSFPAAGFPSSLYNLEVPPPQSAWTKIQSALDNVPARVIPVPRKIIPVWRYAAAAIIAGLILLAGFMVFNSGNSSDPEIAVTNNNNPGPVNTSPLVQPVEKTTENSLTQEKQDDAALEESKTSMAKLDIPGNRVINRTSIDFDDRIHTQSAAFADFNPENTYRELCYVSFDEPAHEDNLATTAMRYVLLMTPDGHFIRMSRKLSDLVCCVAGEDQDAECRDQITNWRQKIAASAHSNSPGNFMDILNLVKSLQENRE